MNTGYKIQNVIGRFENGVFQIQYDFTSNPNATPTDLVNATGMSLQRATELINSRYVLDLVDCPVPQYGTIQFEQTAYTVQEPNIGVTNLIVTLIRQGGCDGNVVATIDVVGGTALPINDYTNIFPTTVTWLDGDCSNKTITIPIIGDTLDETNETIILGITNITNASIGTNTQTTITIVDNDTDYIVNVINSNTSTCNVTGVPLYPYNQTVMGGGSVSLPINTTCLVTAVLINNVNQSTSVVSQANTGSLVLNGVNENKTVTLVYGNFPCPTLTMSPATLPSYNNTFYSETLTTTGGTAPYTYSVISGNLPTGLSLSPTGVISGTGTQNGIFNFTVRSRDANLCTVTQNYVLQSACPVSGLNVLNNASTCSFAGISNFNNYQYVTNGTDPSVFTITSGSLPPGITMSPSGLINGTVTNPGVYVWTTQVVDSQGCIGTFNSQVEVYSNFTINETGSLTGAVGDFVSWTVSVSGNPNVNLIVDFSSLPPGINANQPNSQSVILSGTLTTVGNYTVNYQVSEFPSGCTLFYTADFIVF